MAAKIKVSTATLCGCFGCHMSLLDIDERLFELVKIVEFERTPLTDIKTIGHCDIGIIEGGVANSENVEVLKEFRKKCDILIAFGECSIMGGIPAMRNFFSLKDCLEEAYIHGVTSEIGANTIPNHEDIPKLLNNVYPCNEVVKIDYHIPGCPPSADTLWEILVALLNNKPIDLPYELIKYD